MAQYDLFSTVYDLFMDNVPYKKWSDEIELILKEYGITDGIVLDLGCGTGTLTRLLADKGYDMIGIDSSEDMLMEAMDKVNVSEQEQPDILFLNQDITDFELYGTVRAVISTCDSLNYIIEEDELLNTFKLVNNYLEPDGVFIFDMNAPEKYTDLLADNVFAENRDSSSFIWENSYDSKTHINEYNLTLYIEEEEGVYSRSEEQHYQRAYLREEIAELLEKSGLEVVMSTEEDYRMYYVVKVIEGRKLGNTGL